MPQKAKPKPTKKASSGLPLASKQPINKTGLMAFVGIIAIVGIAVLVKVHGATFYPLALENLSGGSGQLSESATLYDPISKLTTTMASLSTASKDLPRYSPDHSKVVWGSWNNKITNGNPNSTIQIYTVANKTTKTVAMPAGVLEIDNTRVSPAWFPNNTSLVLTGVTVSNNKAYLYEYNGTSISQVPNVTADDITDVTVTGDGHIVYGSTSGVYSVYPGFAPVKILSAAYGCRAVHARPGSTTNVSAICSTSTGSTINNLSDKGVNTVVYNAPSSQANGASYNNLEDITWSPDGTKLGVLYDVTTNTAATSCSASLQSKVGRISASGGGSLTTIASLPAYSHTGCYGGGGPADQMIVWDSTNTYMIFEGYTSYESFGGIYRISATSSSVQTPTLVSSTVPGSLDW